MVICKCRKTTKLYCFVHKVPVCGECISSPEHKLCVVKTYSEWVIDGDYDWPPKCVSCGETLQDTDDVTRLGCFHVLHSRCLETHLQSFPPHTAPAGYTCPACPTSIWPPKSLKDTNSAVHTKLREVITLSGRAGTLLGSDTNAPSSSSETSPPKMSSSPLDTVEGSESSSKPREDVGVSSTSTSEVDGSEIGILQGVQSNREAILGNETRSFQEIEPSSSGQRNNQMESSSAPALYNKAGSSPAMHNGITSKSSVRIDISDPSTLGYDDDDDEDGSHRKYSRRGPLYQQILRSLVPFWSSGLPTLPVTSSSHRDKREFAALDDSLDSRTRRKQKQTATVDSRRLLLAFAILSCLGTVALLYYRLLQNLSGSSESAHGDQLPG